MYIIIEIKIYLMSSKLVGKCLLLFLFCFKLWKDVSESIDGLTDEQLSLYWILFCFGIALLFLISIVVMSLCVVD